MEHAEKKTKNPWNMVDPRPPVIQSGHMENHLAQEDAAGAPPDDLTGRLP